MFLGTLRAIITDEDLPRRLARLRGRFANFRPVLEGPVEDFIRSEIDKQFETEGQHFGTPWQALADETLRWRASHGYPPGPILIASGTLWSSLVNKDDPNGEVEVTKEGLTIRSLVPWGAVHQSGEDRSGRIPRRPIIPDEFPEDFLKRIRNMVTGYILAVEFGTP